MSQKYPGGFITKSPVAPSQGIAPGIWTLEQALQLKKQGVWPPLVPGAPTIGTATATGSTTATVVFTAPAGNGGSVITSYTATSTPSSITGTLSQAGSGTITVTGLSPSTSYTFTAPAGNGGSVITSYTATSSPGSVTGTLSQAGSGTITVTGLTGGTAYTFTVTATNAIGTSAASAASNSITTVPVVGAAFGGGFFAGQISTAGNGVADFNLVVGPVSSAESVNIQWKTSGTGGESTSVIDGPTNSAAMNSATFPAAQFCEGLTIGGFSDWYMPAQNELEVCYYNLKPDTTNNNTNSGINANAVPARASNYTAGVPAQTSAAAFQSGGAEAYSTPTYWSSTQSPIYSQNAMYIRFSNGNLNSASKTGASGYRVRAIRRIAV